MLLLLALGCADATVDASDPPRNLIVVSIDTLRRDHVGRYSGGVRALPFLDGWLSDALTLDAHRSCANWTYPSLICALSGRAALEWGFVPDGDAEEIPPMPDAISTLGEHLAAAGFESSLVSTNPFLNTNFGLARGYDRAFGDAEWPAEEVVEQTLATLEDIEDAERWFLHAHFMDPHSPWGAPDDYLDGLEGLEPVAHDLSTQKGVVELQEDWAELSAGERARYLEEIEIRYAAEVVYLDDQLAILFEELQARGALEDALTVIFSDHGEQLFDHGELLHRKGLHDEEVAAIAALRGPGQPRLAWGEPTTHADLAPTILAGLGLSIPAQMSGLPVGEADPERPRFAEVIRRDEETRQSVDVGSDRLIYQWSGRLRRYDLSADPSESEDLYTSGDARSAELWSLLAPQVDALSEIFTEESPTPPE